MTGAPAPERPGEADTSASGTSAAESALDERSRRILAFEARSFGHPGAKAEAVRAEFGLSAARYYRLLAGLIDSPAALRHDPMLVKRLQRMRDARAASRDRRSLSLGRALD
ncbi:DUF3263 domain-containing protein [Agromyces aerolatus]|uniref:DUF3263 domain-containing protein n=1 Tax=Agromyces sp. LY-1074 TaxID=3074080 RepID=UPI002860F638|nr:MULTISPECIES: DUF3263 domain-containing protein [unclassified Agromyces]MDR5699704.1 DUF3263 domain-containing protein [Agromyces sp. LY-1074]MDR5706000.1 DUF3263 domain-containing protein [Agromyces sp. LY-1358]